MTGRSLFRRKKAGMGIDAVEPGKKKKRRSGGGGERGVHELAREKGSTEKKKKNSRTRSLVTWIDPF